MPSSVLQIIAMLSMFIDHTAYIQTYGNAHVIFLNYIGRLAFPIFCFQVAIGYKKTKDLGKYILRLLAIAGISQIPYFIFFNKVTLMKPGLNVIFTLLFGIIAILIYDFTVKEKKIKINTGLSFVEKYSKLSIPKIAVLFAIKIIAIILICYLADKLNLEYGAVGIVLILGIYVLYPFKEEQRSKWIKVTSIIIYAIIVCLFTYFEAKTYFQAVYLGMEQYVDELIGLVVGNVIGCAIPFLYNGKKGRKLKIFGYIFYPLQFAIIVLVNMLVH